MENKLSNEGEYFKYEKLLYDLYERLYDEGQIHIKGQEDIRFNAFGKLYYSLVENPWKSIGITKNLLQELQSNDFKPRKPDEKKILMTRAHIYERACFFKKLFSEEKKTSHDLLSFLWHTDITIMSLSYENKDIQEILNNKGGYLFPDQGYKSLFPARTIGFKYTKKVQEELSNFFLNPNKELIKTNGEMGTSFEIMNEWK